MAWYRDVLGLELVVRQRQANAYTRELFRRIKVHLRENCVVGIPVPPTSCSVATTNVMDRVANAVQRALAELSPGHGLAEVGLGMPPSVAVVSGRDPRRDGQPFINQVVFAWTGGAAGPVADGWLTAGEVGDGGVVFRDSVEIDEMLHPIRIDRQEIIPDSEGAGRFRGAPGAIAEFGPVGCELEVLYVSDGTISPALGVRGGGTGAPADQKRRDRSGQLLPAEPCGHLTLQPGETVVSISCGGGGYGPPADRDPERVRQDVAEGWITAARAAEVYGVVLLDSGAVDVEATEAARARIRSAGPQ